MSTIFLKDLSCPVWLIRPSAVFSRDFVYLHGNGKLPGTRIDGVKGIAKKESDYSIGACGITDGSP